MDTLTHWIEVERDGLFEAISALAEAPILPKRASKKRDKLQRELRLVLLLRDEELILTTGAFETRTKARGEWKSSAVLPFQALQVLKSLVESLPPSETIRLHGEAERLRIGHASLPCRFEDPKPQLARIDEAERDLQQIVDRKALVDAKGSPTPPEPGLVLDRIRKAAPSCQLLPLERETAIWFPQCSHLLIHLRKLRVDIRRIPDANRPQTVWLQDSVLCKTLTYRAVQELGIPGLLPYAQKLVESCLKTQDESRIEVATRPKRSREPGTT